MNSTGTKQRVALATVAVSVAVTAALAAGLTGCAGDGVSVGSAPATAVTTAGPAGSAGQQRLNEFADRIREVGQRRFPDVYSGVEVNLDAGMVVAYRRTAAEFDRAVRAELPDAPVRFQDAPYAERQIAAWADTVRRDLAYWQARDTPVHSVVGRHDGTCVELGTMAVDAVTAQARVRYPDMPVCVVTGGPGWGATSAAGSPPRSVP
jgi:hypothetical protein